MTLFRLTAALVLLAAIFSGPVHAQSGADGAAIQKVITSQIEAFKRDDASAAFQFAAPVIKEKFSSPDIFMSMVRRGYDPVYRPSDYDFGDLVEIQGRLVQQVFLTDRRGVPVMALYTMEQQADGSWRISGVRLTRPPGNSA